MLIWYCQLSYCRWRAMPTQVNWSNPVLWFGLILFAIIGFCGLYLANGSWREALR